MKKTDFLVIGSGIAGLNFALRAAKHGKVIVITKKDVTESNTNYAQGGIAAVQDNLRDNFKSHYIDTLKAGAYHNNKKAVKFLVMEGPKLIKRLVKLGVNFDNDNGKRLLTKEGGHSHRRVAFSGDSTGHEIEQKLVKNVKKNKNIEVLESSLAIDLIVEKGVCYGAQVLKGRQVFNIFSKATILATGGAGKVYKNSTNPEISTGDGLAMAARAKAKLKDMEFVQFHPTALNLKRAPPFLISEVVRGEGAVLKNSKKERFMHKYHNLKELAPRDIVARAIIAEEKKGGKVYLDISREKPEFVKKRFPTIYKKLKKYKLDMTKNLIPVSPAAHYMCGGIQVNLNGETNIKKLFAFGEVACTGVHGANRLASNSLLEAIVFSDQIIKTLKSLKNKTKIVQIKKPKYSNHKKYLSIKKKIQKIMWNHVGIIRTEAGLKKAIMELRKVEEKLNKPIINKGLAETRNMLQVGKLIAEAAMKRKKSLGTHHRLK